MVAIGSLFCGLAQFALLPLAHHVASITSRPVPYVLLPLPAIMLGHAARMRIRRSAGSRSVAALSGLILGYSVLALFVLDIGLLYLLAPRTSMG